MADAKQKELYLRMYDRMLLIRNFDDTAARLMSEGQLVGAVHTYVGEEAVAVGACAALNDDDYITGNHRSHGHPIAKGADVNRAMAELFGKRTGYCKGKGGSMHLADFSVGILGESGILASGVPVAMGAAMASWIRGNQKVAMTFFGDGASNEGACHESMNMASIFKFPVIFLCENNQYAMSDSFKKMVAVENISDRASAYNMPGVLVDGQDVVAVYEVVREAVARARAGQGPSLVECRTYRYNEHSEGMGRILDSLPEDQRYRSTAEVAQWRARDPIQLHRKRLLDQKIATEAELKQHEDKAAKAIEDSLTFARESAYPGPEEIWDDLFTNPITIER